MFMQSFIKLSTVNGEKNSDDAENNTAVASAGSDYIKYLNIHIVQPFEFIPVVNSLNDVFMFLC